jgi:hypothetical protein
LAHIGGRVSVVVPAGKEILNEAHGRAP